MTGREVCRMHGGKSPRGAASPHTKTGRWSKDLPTRLAAKYAESENDPDLMSLRQDIQLIDTLIKAKFDKLETVESEKSWGLMRASVEVLEFGIDKEDWAGCQKALRSMRDVIDGRVAHYATEAEIRSQLDQRRKLVETEHKMTLAGEQAITHEKAMLFVGAIGGIIRARVHDPNILSAIQSDIALLLDVRETAG